ncbi:NAD(P)-dependent dehydrogenase, short-chain alcohol dehydrogenase family [Pseudonocardia thermophila]|uniref:NAD(P)-dependent dehydrogenase, short-chain alcohol dehydrogenase family n=1 Tax=Pseudonocardia thermophila TaxID=1848 RepID=A0A1M7BAD3_PSETH|nr:glucose 1-dehydrogenase [Pseudonocardia thermophila]SHL51887.1 NAD(P)-dependent dehydrogenase, short-chain alcohol dehydrogenase family [Pseudonocardia thermophila]
MDFENKVAVVTGGGNGIGNATCVAFARHGADVVVVDRDEAAAEATAKTIRESGRTAVAVAADVTNPADVQRYVAAAVEHFGRIDCFFNNAGIGGRIAPITEYTDEDFATVIDVNLRGVFLGLRHVLRQMQQQGNGAVVNTSSAAALLPGPGLCAYVASKNAVLGLTRVAAAEVADRGIRVNAVCPGPVETQAMRLLDEQAGGEEAIRRRRAALPTGRYSTPEEVANVVLFLCSDLAANTTGAHYVVDGGRTAISGVGR